MTEPRTLISVFAEGPDLAHFRTVRFPWTSDAADLLPFADQLCGVSDPSDAAYDALDANLIPRIASHGASLGDGWTYLCTLDSATGAIVLTAAIVAARHLAAARNIGALPGPVPAD